MRINEPIRYSGGREKMMSILQNPAKRKAASVYRGKYPNRIVAVFTNSRDSSVLSITTKDGRNHKLDSKNGIPKIGEDASDYGIVGKMTVSRSGVVKQNPRNKEFTCVVEYKHWRSNEWVLLAGFVSDIEATKFSSWWHDEGARSNNYSVRVTAR